MKKFLILTILLFGLVGVSFAQTNEDAYRKQLYFIMLMCKEMQQNSLATVPDIENCRFSSININKKFAFIFRRVENNKCYYTKMEMEDILHGHDVANCHAPLSEMKSLSETYSAYLNSMCDNLNSENKYQSLLDKKLKHLETYCKPVKQ